MDTIGDMLFSSKDGRQGHVGRVPSTDNETESQYQDVDDWILSIHLDVCTVLTDRDTITVHISGIAFARMRIGRMVAKAWSLLEIGVSHGRGNEPAQLAIEV